MIRQQYNDRVKLVKNLEDKKILEIFEKYNVNCISIGEISNELLSFLETKHSGISNMINNRTILMWKDRIEHLNKHSYETTDFTVENMLKILPEIIKNPDYVGIRDKDMSIQFIKEYDNNVLVAVRMDNKGNLKFRTMYTINQSQLSSYIKKDRAWKFGIDNQNGFNYNKDVINNNLLSIL